MKGGKQFPSPSSSSSKLVADNDDDEDGTPTVVFSPDDNDDDDDDDSPSHGDTAETSLDDSNDYSLVTTASSSPLTPLLFQQQQQPPQPPPQPGTVVPHDPQQQQGVLLNLTLSSRQQMWFFLWGFSTLTSALVFATIVLPWTALAALALGLTSTAALLRTAYTALVVQASNVPQEEWLAFLLRYSRSLLPTTAYQYLMEYSLHDLLSPNPDFDFTLFVNEYRHLLLYFMPIEAHRLTELIEQLPPRHLHQLQQPGFLARMLLGDDVFLRRQQQQQQQHNTPPCLVAEGEEMEDGGGGGGAQSPLVSDIPIVFAQPQHQLPQPVHTAFPTIPAPPSSGRRRLDYGDDDDSSAAESDLGLDLSPNDFAGGLTDQQASQMARSLQLVGGGTSTPTACAAAGGPSPTATATMSPLPGNSSTQQQPVSAATASSPSHVGDIDEDNDDVDDADDVQEEYALEERLLTEAITDSLRTYGVPAAQSLWAWLVEEQLRPATHRVFQIGLSLSLVSTGLGALGYYQRNYNSSLQGGGGGRGGGTSSTSSLSLNLILIHATSSRYIWTTAVLGMGTAGLALLTRSVLLWTVPRQQQDAANDAASSARRESSVKSNNNKLNSQKPKTE